jgi:tripeptidyl-peptidase-1
MKPTPQPWEEVRRPNKAAWVKLTFALRQRNLDHLEQLLLNVSNPRHALWGKHLSFEEVNDLVAPHPDSVSAVEGWLQRSGISPRSIDATPNKDFIHASLPLKQAEAILGINFTLLQHKESRRFALQSSRYAVPSDIVMHLDFLHSALASPPAYLDLSLDESIRADSPDPMHLFKNGKPRFKNMVASSSRSGYIPQHHAPAYHAPVISASALYDKDEHNYGMTPSKILHHYNDLEGHAGFKAHGVLPVKNAETFQCDGVPVGQAVASYLGESADINGDLQHFFRQFFPEEQGQKPVIHRMDHTYKNGLGGTVDANEEEATPEASLDLQYLMAIGAGVKTEVWATSGRSSDKPTSQPNHDQNEPLLQWLINLSKTRCPPAVFSVSYADNEDSWSEDLATRVNHEFKKVCT